MACRCASSYEQLDWRWSARYRELVRYDAIQWLTPAAFSLAERETWAQFQEQSPSGEGQQCLEARISQSREREILAALSEGCEPRLHYPRIPIAEVMQKREGLRALAEEIACDEPNAVVPMNARQLACWEHLGRPQYPHWGTRPFARSVRNTYR
jgi:hypothetical protein